MINIENHQSSISSLHLGIQSGPCEDQLIKLDEQCSEKTYKVISIYKVNISIQNFVFFLHENRLNELAIKFQKSMFLCVIPNQDQWYQGIRNILKVTFFCQSLGFCSLGKNINTLLGGKESCSFLRGFWEWHKIWNGAQLCGRLLNTRSQVGVMYCRAGQQTEEEMYNNEEGGPAFNEFLDVIGQRVRLKGFGKYKAGLCNKSEAHHYIISIPSILSFSSKSWLYRHQLQSGTRSRCWVTPELHQLALTSLTPPNNPFIWNSFLNPVSLPLFRLSGLVLLTSC